MKFVEILTTAATMASAVAAPTKKRASRFQFVGVNESGAEFGNTALPGILGKDYTWPDQNAINVCFLVCSSLVGEGDADFPYPARR